MNLRSPAAALAVCLTLPLVAACTGEEPVSDDAPTISLDAITIGPMDDATADPALEGDDEYCALMQEALVLTHEAGLVIDDAIASLTADAVLGGGDLGPINDAGSTVNTYGVESRELYDRAILLVEEPEIVAGFDAMIDFIEMYTLPVALVMVAATDFSAMAADLGEISTSPDVQSALAAAPDHQVAVEEYTEDRCGVEIDVFTLAE